MASEQVVEREGQWPRLVCIQFAFSNPSHVPDSIWWREEEKPEEQKQRKGRPCRGEMLVAPREKGFLADFLEDLLNPPEKYQLVAAEAQPRPHPKNKRKFFMVRFIFVPEAFAEPLDPEKNMGFNLQEETLLEDLSGMVCSAMWRIRAFRNPFFINGKPSKGEFTWSINLEAREPLNEDGVPRRIWERNKNGEKTEKKILLAPDWSLRISEGGELTEDPPK